MRLAHHFVPSSPAKPTVNQTSHSEGHKCSHGHYFSRPIFFIKNSYQNRIWTPPWDSVHCTKRVAVGNWQALVMYLMSSLRVNSGDSPTFRKGSCDVLSTSKRSLKGCSTFWPHIQVRHWNSYWVRSVTYDRILSADRYGIRMANKKMIDMRAFLTRCLKLSPQGCTTNGLKLDKCKAWLHHLNAAACPRLCHLSKNQAICRLSSE